MRLKWFKNLRPSVQVLIFFVFLLVILPFYLSFSMHIKSAISSLLLPPFEVAGGITANARQILKFQDLIRENQELEARNHQLSMHVIQMEEDALENERLRRILELPKRRRIETETAVVIGRDSSNWSRTLMINKGKNSGINTGMAVVLGKGVVGRIIESSAQTSRVSLMVDFNSKIPARIFRTREQGVVFGTFARGRNLAQIKYIQDVKPGDRVITSGLAGIYPRGLLIGKIISVREEENRLYKIADIQPEIDFARLEEVMVVTSR